MAYDPLNKMRITAERAKDSAQRLIDAGFNKKDVPRPRFCIPTQATDDDVTILGYIDQRESEHAAAMDVLRVIAEGRTSNGQRTAQRYLDELAKKGREA